MSDETPLECLSRLGTSGVLWAQEFNKTAVRLGYSEMDEEWLAGWFANAIENCDVIRCNPLRAENEKLREALISCAIDLEVEISARYHDCNGKVHPALQRKYDNDMSTVRTAAAAIRESGDE